MRPTADLLCNFRGCARGQPGIASLRHRRRRLSHKDPNRSAARPNSGLEPLRLPAASPILLLVMGTPSLESRGPSKSDLEAQCSLQLGIFSPWLAGRDYLALSKGSGVNTSFLDRGTYRSCGTEFHRVVGGTNLFFGITPGCPARNRMKTLIVTKVCLWSDSCCLLMFCVLDSAVFHLVGLI